MSRKSSPTYNKAHSRPTVFWKLAALLRHRDGLIPVVPDRPPPRPLRSSMAFRARTAFVERSLLLSLLHRPPASTGLTFSTWSSPSPKPN